MNNEEMMFVLEKLKDQEIFDNPNQVDEFTRLVFRAIAKKNTPDILDNICYKLKLSKKEVPKIVGISYSTLNDILNGDAIKMRDAAQDKIYEVCDILIENKEALSKLTSKEIVNFVKTAKLVRGDKGISTEIVFATPEFIKWFNEEWPKPIKNR